MHVGDLIHGFANSDVLSEFRLMLVHAFLELTALVPLIVLTGMASTQCPVYLSIYSFQASVEHNAWELKQYIVELYWFKQACYVAQTR
ncbi:hypothetical protein RJ641_026854 [Dillenia turbinata]|uniref:Uncharacterized protein n=1 Tax=Dillenia turbinata TaxID=194707 RepID=A0AAN8ZL44_9MAGN